MALHIKVIPGLKIVLVKAADTVETVDIFNLNKFLLSSKEFKPGMNQLVDITSVDKFNVNSDDMRKIVQSDLEAEPRLKIKKTAFVTDKPHVYGMMRMYQALSSKMKTDIGVFKEMKEACDWLNLKPEEIKSELPVQ